MLHHEGTRSPEGPEEPSQEGALGALTESPAHPHPLLWSPSQAAAVVLSFVDHGVVFPERAHPLVLQSRPAPLPTCPWASTTDLEVLLVRFRQGEDWHLSHVGHRGHCEASLPTEHPDPPGLCGVSGAAVPGSLYPQAAQ